MAKFRQLGKLERAVMEQLWDSAAPKTVREVHAALCVRRPLAYTTVMTVLRRLAEKELVDQIRDERAFRYIAAGGRDELIAGLMVDALDDVTEKSHRQAALMSFVGRVGADEAAALRHALTRLESGRAGDVRELESAGSQLLYH
ncbi:BlaI/MecI/CopY family transcriptional regulator [Mycobacterium sp. smrl_JER01]|uniref:BlaI/MecI/CopY family transcriptional regulator n=1 Tax=Mycobacterium sp. smrl_JER01 TaxID=3402633 RepID=UPI003ACA691F